MNSLRECSHERVGYKRGLQPSCSLLSGSPCDLLSEYTLTLSSATLWKRYWGCPSWTFHLQIPKAWMKINFPSCVAYLVQVFNYNSKNMTVCQQAEENWNLFFFSLIPHNKIEHWGESMRTTNVHWITFNFISFLGSLLFSLLII